LEGAKHKALVEIDASAYDTSVREQVRLLSASRTSTARQVSSVEQLLALSQLITLNTRLLQNLVSTTPWSAFNQNAYTAKGRVATASAADRRRMSIEA
jgi:hypothetical protein